MIMLSPETLQLSIVIPTYNERDSILALVRDVLTVMAPNRLEIIVVDDASPDGTGDVVKRTSGAGTRVRLVQRHSKAGLASAVFEERPKPPASLSA